MSTKRDPQKEFDKLISETPLDVKMFVDLSFDIIDEVDQSLSDQGKNRVNLAILLDKSESEISKMLSGMHNLTIKSLTKIGAALNKEILTTPSKEAKIHASIIEELNARILKLEDELAQKYDDIDFLYLFNDQKNTVGSQNPELAILEIRNFSPAFSGLADAVVFQQQYDNSKSNSGSNKTYGRKTLA